MTRKRPVPAHIELTGKLQMLGVLSQTIGALGQYGPAGAAQNKA